MKKLKNKLITAWFGIWMANAVQADVLQDLIDEMKQQTAIVADEASGKKLWETNYFYKSTVKVRSCGTCHGKDLREPGRHISTAKVIQPMSAKQNPQRYQSRAKIKKWLMRNCKWNLNRECTVQEKMDVLTYLKNN